MKVKVHDWNLPANERIILPLTEHNYNLNFIGFLIKPLPSALTCSTTAVNLLPRTGICFSLPTKVFICIPDGCEEQRAGTLSPLFLWEFFPPYHCPLLTINLHWPGSPYIILSPAGPSFNVLVDIVQVYAVVGAPESMQPGGRAGPFPPYTDQNLGETTSGGDALEWL